MKKKSKRNRRTLKGQSGFTLIEILIVVILLGVLATIIIPQISVSSDDAKQNALKTNLINIRSLVELYYYQHNNTYPGGRKNDGTATPNETEAATAFAEQLTQFTDIDGKVSTSYTGSYVYGPYLKGAGLPTNPYNNQSDVVCDISTTNITTRNSASSDNAWKFYTQTGILIAADGTAGTHDNL